ncbi:MAG: tautomerase family protein [Rhodopila sp.]|jgi:Tautomerase enzyme|nr:tautomerase family protein [Rhodopila sp.]
MPLFTITMRSGRRGADKGAVSAAIHAASVSAGYPQNDMFQRFFSLEADDLLIDPTYPVLPKPRTDELLMIEILVSSGTEAKQKHALLAALIARLDMIGVDKNDVMVFFGEVDRASSSFGNGKLAPPVVIG